MPNPRNSTKGEFKKQKQNPEEHRRMETTNDLLFFTISK